MFIEQDSQDIADSSLSDTYSMAIFFFSHLNNIEPRLLIF